MALPVVQVQQEDAVRLPSREHPSRGGSQLQGRVPETLAGFGHRGRVRRPPARQVPGLQGVHVRGGVHRGGQDPQSLARHRLQAHLAHHVGLRAEAAPLHGGAAQAAQVLRLRRDPRPERDALRLHPARPEPLAHALLVVLLVLLYEGVHLLQQPAHVQPHGPQLRLAAPGRGQVQPASVVVPAVLPLLRGGQGEQDAVRAGDGLQRQAQDAADELGGRRVHVDVADGLLRDGGGRHVRRDRCADPDDPDERVLSRHRGHPRRQQH